MVRTVPTSLKSDDIFLRNTPFSRYFVHRTQYKEQMSVNLLSPFYTLVAGFANSKESLCMYHSQ